jgi:RimJ/RimL family protein N-acetyltransferase
MFGGNGCRGWKPASNCISCCGCCRRTSFLGAAGLHDIGNEEPEIGIWLKEAAHGLGYGREAIAAMVAWASTNVGATSVIYPVVEINHPSRRLAESLSGVIAGHRVLKKAKASFNEVVYRIPCAS